MKKLFELLTSPEAYFYSVGLATGMVLFAPNGFVFLLGIALFILSVINMKIRQHEKEKENV